MESGLLCIGHRGAMGHAPENTVASFQKALELGAQCVELDVYHVDRTLFVFHDDRLERTTNGTGYLAGSSAAALRALDAGNGQRIPTLGEVFAVVDRRAGVNIELKGPGTARPVVAFITDLRQNGWPDDLILVSSFDHPELARVAALDQRIKLGVLTAGPPVDAIAVASELGAYAVHPALDWVDRRFVADAHDRGLRVFVYTVNDPGDIRRMADLGVDGLFTNYPERVLAHGGQGRRAIGWP